MFDDLSDEVLESELCTQAAELGAGECHLLLVMAELERREVWARQGARSCAHWLSWRIGTALGAAREQLRVARSLEKLPCVREAFAAGELSYSKVRAISRVASSELDEHLLELARHATALELEQIVREYRRADPGERARAEAARRGRYLRHRSDSEGMVVITCRLPPDEAAVVLAAIERVRAELADEGEAGAVEVADESPARGSCEPTDVSAETSPEPSGAGEASEAAAQPAPEDPGERAGRDLADALVTMCASVLSNGIGEVEDPHVTVLVHVDEEVLRDDTAPGCAHLDGLGAITAHAAARLACDAAVTRLSYRQDGAVEPLGSTRVVPSAMRRAVLARDRSCRFPGCTARRFLHAHHVVYASHGGPTAMSNLVALCSRHHHLVHDGGWSLQLSPGGRLRVFSPEGTEVARVPQRPAASAEGLAGHNRARGVEPDPDKLRGDGEPFDLGMTIDGLLWLRAASSRGEGS